jgi:hypothetical protein
VKETEKRTLPLDEIRIFEQEEQKGLEIIGHAAVFDSWSETIGGIFPFREKVRRGAFSESIKKDDIRALFNHSADYVLGRNKAGTLELIEDDKGLLVKIKPPDTQWAKDLITSIRRGDIDQMSFGFITEDEDWTSENGIDVRELRKVKLFDVSPVTFPAYTATDVGIRGMESYKEYRSKLTEYEENKAKAMDILKIKKTKNKFKFM